MLSAAAPHSAKIQLIAIGPTGKPKRRFQARVRVKSSEKTAFGGRDAFDSFELQSDHWLGMRRGSLQTAQIASRDRPKRASVFAQSLLLGRRMSSPVNADSRMQQPAASG